MLLYILLNISSTLQVTPKYHWNDLPLMYLFVTAKSISVHSHIHIHTQEHSTFLYKKNVRGSSYECHIVLPQTKC